MSEKEAFEILGMDRWCDRGQVLRKVMEKLSQSPENMVRYRQAQADLFDPGKRILMEFFDFPEHLSPRVSESAKHRSSDAGIDSIRPLPHWGG
ncbi:MAG: hypothetical protein HYW48_10950 [Deltaproteobacteria bacterium]|nr:hypothetical protein [Deltaproteobacteria bacterium]